MAYPAVAYPSPQFGVQSEYQQAPTQVVGPQFCAPTPVAFLLQDKLSWSRGDATILDGNGAVAFSVEGDAMSWKGNRVVKDASGNIVVSLRLKVTDTHPLHAPDKHDLYLSYIPCSARLLQQARLVMARGPSASRGNGSSTEGTLYKTVQLWPVSPGG